MVANNSNETVILPVDIWIHILLVVDDESLQKCRSVCRTWSEILNKGSFWFEKCRRIGYKFPLWLIKRYNFDHRHLYCRRPFDRNLIKNPSGEYGLKHWNILQNGGKGFKVQRCNFQNQKFPICFATSYGACVKEQVIDLHKEGCDQVVLDELQPRIIGSEWHVVDTECAIIYKLHIVLLKDVKAAVDSMDPLHGFWTDNHDGNFPFYRYDSKKVVDEFYITTILENQTWTEICHTFENYGPGVRYVLFQSYGRCRQYNTGHYGPKMANASIHLSLDLERQRKQQ